MLHAHSHGLDIVRDKWLMECHKLKDIKIINSTFHEKLKLVVLIIIEKTH